MRVARLDKEPVLTVADEVDDATDARGDDRAAAKKRLHHEARSRPEATWQLAGDVGRRYAAVSGDRNPIHLHPLTARLFGFPRPIAHGMWSKARCLAALEGLLPDRLAVEVEFKKPLPLPSRVSFASAADGDRRAFDLRDARSGAPHVVGSLRPG